MEKIKTPLMTLLEELQKHIKPSCSDHSPFRGICQNCHNHNVFNVLDLTPEQLVEKVQSLLPTERDVIIKMAENAYWDIVGSGVISTTDQNEIRSDAESLFTETFKSYE